MSRTDVSNESISTGNLAKVTSISTSIGIELCLRQSVTTSEGNVANLTISLSGKVIAYFT